MHGGDGSNPQYACILALNSDSVWHLWYHYTCNIIPIYHSQYSLHFTLLVLLYFLNTDSTALPTGSYQLHTTPSLTWLCLSATPPSSTLSIEYVIIHSPNQHTTNKKSQFTFIMTLPICHALQLPSCVALHHENTRMKHSRLLKNLPISILYYCH